ncbi:MAG: c-type cytochrome, partial [Chloroflexi bacterium]|nr:c-type cytochrome [Chloroflexota bacterium]
MGYLIQLSRPGVDVLKRLLSFLLLHKRLVLLVVGITGFGVPLVILASYQVIETVDSTGFCTQVCHKVHYPEAVTLVASPHKEVTCSACHVGPGTRNLVESKLRGLRDIIPTVTNTYPHPIPTPLKERRPSSQTCEKCHWAEKFSGDMPVVETSYSLDQQNTRNTIALVLKVNGGREEVASGIHWHSTAKVWYLPVDSERLKIAWAGVEDASGNITEYTDPNLMSGITSERLDKEKRLMDCMDCHNRATHLFRPPDQLIDMALTDGSIDTKLPFIKAEALKALVPQNESLDQAYTRIAEIKEFYRTSYPQVFQEKEASIDNAITKLREIAVLTTFSGNLDWNTHKDNSGHDKPDSEMQIDWDTLSSLDQSSGCFRCHGNLEKAESKGGNGTDRVKFLSPGSGTAGTGGINPGATRTSGSGTGLNGSNGTISSKGGSPEGKLDAECNLCHYTLTSPFISPLAPATSHPIDGLDKCLTCHSPEAPKPFKTDHPWSTNEACNTCHQAAPKLKSLSSVTLSAPSEKPITHSTNKMDDCLVCHSPTASSPIKDDHPWSTNETCNACHEPAKKLKPIPSPTPVTDKPITHSTEKMDDCLVCHAPSASSPVKNDHPWSANENCVSCHQLAPKLKPLPLAVPPKASEVTHSTSGLTDCLVCHAPSSPMPFKADHPWSTNETCSSCHKQAAVIKSFAPSTGGFGSPVTHSVSGLGSCSACHNQGGTARFPASHAGRPDSFCLLCHQSAAGQVPNQPPPPPPAMVVPPVAHPVDAARQDCLLCHGPSGTSPFGSSHAGRTIYTCLLCHQLSSTQQTAPSAPTGLTATASSVTLVNLTWVDNAGDETGFRIQRATDNAFTANVVAMTAGANAMSYSDAGVSGSTTYYYRVLAYNSAGDSAASNTASVTTPIPTGTAPAAPTGLAATASSATQVNLTWVDNAGNETGYRIDRAADSTFTTNLVTMTAGANITSYSDSTVVGSTIYYYRVFAYNAAGNSTASNTANVTTPAPPIDPAALYTTSCASCHGASRQGSASGPAVTAGALAGRTLTQITTSLTTGSMSGYTSGMTSAERAALAEWLKGYPPAAPTTLAATAVSAGQVNLTWVDNAGDETGYRIERATNNTFTANSITHTVGANTTSYSDTTVSGSTTYYYRVYAYNVSGDSATSNTASVTTPVATGSPPSVPTAVAAEALSATQVILSWEDNSNNETGFRIERATNDTFSANLVTTNVAANVTSYTDTTVSGETRYYYRMFAYNAAGSSSESNKCSVTTPTPPIDPAALYSSNCASCHGANREGGSASALTPAALAGRSLSQVTNTIAGGVGSMPGYSSLMTSNEMSALAEWLKGYPPAAPTTLSATAVSAGQVNLTWVDNASDETGYRIERATNNTFTANLITNTAGANATSYNDATVSGSTTYYYRVYAYNVSGDSAASNTASVT